VNQLSRALKDCDSDKRSTRANLKVRRKDFKTLAERMEGFGGLDDAAKAVDGIEKRHKRAQQIAKANSNLVRLGDRVTRARTEVKALDGLEDAAGKVPPSERVREAREGGKEWAAATRLSSRLSTARDDVEGLAGLEDVEGLLPSAKRVTYVQQFRKAIGVTVGMAMRYEEAKTELARAEGAQEALEGITFDDKKVVRLGKFRKALDNAERMRKRYVEHRDSVKTLDHQIGLMEVELERLTERASEVLGTYQECPTCGGGLDHVHE